MLQCIVILFNIINLTLIGREPMLMMLVKQGAFIDAKDINGMTPLHLAAMKKDA
jgi:ankyrin repeat protein